MTLAETLQPRLDGWAPSGRGRHSWTEAFPEAGWTIHLAADKNDSLSTLVWEMTLVRRNDAPANFTLKAWADGIAARVSGLREDVRVIEIDDIANEALLRSDDPTRKGELASYYELRLTGLTQAVLRRFQANTTTHARREQVPFAVTHEVLADVASQIAG